MKKELLAEMFQDMAKCDLCLNTKNKCGKDCSLINIYKDDFYKEIPSIWTDWFNRVDSKTMVIGQDWGPYVEMKKFRDMYKVDETNSNWERIIDEEKSLTKKMLTKYLVDSGKNLGLDIDDNIIKKIYITNAIMCARSGNNYRSDNIKLKEYSLNCSKYLKRQIDIIKPKVILTLGFYPLLSLSKIYGFKIDKTLNENINNYGSFTVQDMIIIPLYHPAAQISKDKQMTQYDKIWKYYKEV